MTTPSRDKRELSNHVACTLTDTDLKSQRERWLNLWENFGFARQETVDGLRLWAAWSVERSEDGIVMTARSQDEGIAVLHAMFTRAT